MNVESPNQTGLSGVWKRRLIGVSGIGIGIISALFCAGLVAAVDDMDDYYYVPYNCASLECSHPIEQSPDGRSYCAAFPPKDIKMAGVSVGFVRTSQSIVALCGAAGLCCAGLTGFAGLRQAAGVKCWPAGRRGIGLTTAAVAGALGLPFLALFFLWPYGIVPM